MEGRVIKYFNEKGYGFIKDEKGDNRFFHVSNIKSMNQISSGRLVEFIPSNNEKGLLAIDINIIEEKAPVFLMLGDTRIKLSNIKNYGLDYTTVEKIDKKELPLTKTEKILKKTFGIPLGIIGAIDGIAEGGNPSLGINIISDSFVNSRIEERKINITYKVLYITTYQGDNFRFSQQDVDFNIDEKIREIDSYFCK